MKSFFLAVLFAFVPAIAIAQNIVVIKPPPISGTSAGVDPADSNIVAMQGVTRNAISGTANTTATTTTSLIPLVAAKRLYITAFSCANTGSTNSLISFQDGSGGATQWTTIVLAGGGSNLSSGQLPMFRTTAGNALFFAAGSASTTIYCSASGFSGS
jgi:hypothetical protein